MDETLIENWNRVVTEEDDYAILYNAWDEHVSKIKVTAESLEIIETTVNKVVAYYMQ